MPTPNITRRHALVTGAAGAAVLLASSLGADAAVRRPARKWPSGAWYVREYGKIGVGTSCSVGPDGKPRNIGHSLVNYHSADSNDRFYELNEMLLKADPNGRQKVARHCMKTGRVWRVAS